MSTRTSVIVIGAASLRADCAKIIANPSAHAVIIGAYLLVMGEPPCERR